MLYLTKFDKTNCATLKKLGELLKETREAKGLLMRQVAAAINADTAMISKFEKGERKPSRDQITELAKVLEKDEKELLVCYFSDKVASDLQNEDVAEEVLKVAKKKLQQIQNKQTKRKGKNGKNRNNK